MDPKRIVFLGVGAVLAFGPWLAWLWQPERQVRLHTAGLLKSIERRNWDKVQAHLAENYSDRWGYDKPFVLSSLRQVFGSFVFLKIEHEVVTAEADTGRVAARVKVSGQGSPVAQFVMGKVNGLHEPFIFIWKKRGRPLQWELTGVDHPSLEPDAEMRF